MWDPLGEEEQLSKTDPGCTGRLGWFWVSIKPWRCPHLGREWWAEGQVPGLENTKHSCGVWPPGGTLPFKMRAWAGPG